MQTRISEVKPFFRLTKDESAEIRVIFKSHEHLFDQQRAAHLSVILAAEHIRLTHAQLYNFVRCIARTSDQVFPDWIYDLLSEKTKPQGKS